MKKQKTVTLTKDVIAAIEAQAEREGMSFSDIVNKILRDYLETVLNDRSDPEAVEE